MPNSASLDDTASAVLKIRGLINHVPEAVDDAHRRRTNKRLYSLFKSKSVIGWFFRWSSTAEWFFGNQRFIGPNELQRIVNAGLARNTSEAIAFLEAINGKTFLLDADAYFSVTKDETGTFWTQVSDEYSTWNDAEY